MKRMIIMAAGIAALLAISSCQEKSTSRLSSTTIKAAVQTSEALTKASPEQGKVIALAEGSLLSMEIVESEGVSFAPVTKGSLLTTASFGSAKVHAYLEESVSGYDRHYIDNGDIRVSGDVTMAGSTEPYYWLNEINMHMWCFLPAELPLSVGEADLAKASFRYQTPTSMSAQKDIVVSHNKEFHKEGEDGVVDVTLHHALAAVRFDVRLLPADTKVKKVEIVDFQNSGTCTVNDAVSFFTWTPDGSTATFSLDEEASAADGFLPKDSQLFFLMPQTLPENAAITMTFVTSKGEEKTDTVVIGGNKLLAGYTYTFKVSAKYTLENIVEDANGDINFKGKAFQAVAFENLTLSGEMRMKLEFDFNVGQDKQGHHRIRIVEASEYDAVSGDKRNVEGKIIYYRKANPDLFNETLAQTKEQVESITITPRETEADAHASGHAVIEFSVQGAGNGPFHIVYDYVGGNEGNAKWMVRNIVLSIVD